MTAVLTSSYQLPIKFVSRLMMVGKYQKFLKLKLNGISGNLLKIMEGFLPNRYQRVVLNEQVSKWTAVNAGVPTFNLH